MRECSEARPVEVKADVSGTLPILGQFHSYINFEALVSPPRKWEYQKPAPSSAIISLRIGLKLQNVARFQQMVIDLSTPGHSTFGQHMTKDEINAIINPAKESAPLVLEWLKSSGIHAVHDGQWVKADVTVAQAQVLLQTRYGVYLNTVSNVEAIRTLSYSLPEVLKDHVDLIQPTTMFGLEPLIPRASTDNLKRRGDPAVKESEFPVTDCDHSVTPKCLRELYNMVGVIPHSKNDSTIAVAGFLDEYGNRDDLQTFLKIYRPEFAGRGYNTTLVENGLDDQSKPGTEANLDIQYTAGLVPPEAVRYYSVGPVPPPFIPDGNTLNNTNEPYDVLLDFLFNQDSVPDTLSVSYADYEQTVPKSYAERVCIQFSALGARGTTVLAASGDYGVGGSTPGTGENCFTNDGRNATRFQPLFPASCPFVTAVGGTVGMSTERAATLSGGGFSEYFPLQQWQYSSVQTYLSKISSKHRGLFKPTGRAYPDVAAQAEHFQVVVGGKVKSVGGTSASTPVFAAIVWYINDERRSRGERPLGFLNPMLYANPQALKDIVLGSNPGCGTTGFDATPGWDPVTGLGTPDLKKLIAAFAPPSN
ncbi:hypothetical protein BGZ75_002347 [Mortierella antarctica]|nr:hypothetical protein BGZ75_002347 [Mortierella antarctica]